MKNFGLSFSLSIAVAFFSNGSLAAEGSVTAISQPSLSIAVVEAGAALDWKALEPGSAEKTPTSDNFAEQARKVNEQIGNRVEQRIQERLERQLQLDF